MALFGSKKKKQAADTEQPQAEKKERRFGGGGKKPTKKRLDDTLASVVDESEPESTLKILRSNRAFSFNENSSWLVLVMPTAVIGGLSKRHNKDEDKGALVNLMNNDDIEIVVTPDLLEQESLAFIPTEKTLDRMRGFAMLREAQYVAGMVFVDPDTAELAVVPIPWAQGSLLDGVVFEDVVEVSRGRQDVTSLVDPVVAAVYYDEFFADDYVDFGERASACASLFDEAHALIREHGAQDYPTTVEFLDAWGISGDDTLNVPDVGIAGDDVDGVDGDVAYDDDDAEYVDDFEDDVDDDAEYVDDFDDEDVDAAELHDEDELVDAGVDEEVPSEEVVNDVANDVADQQLISPLDTGYQHQAGEEYFESGYERDVPSDVAEDTGEVAMTPEQGYVGSSVPYIVSTRIEDDQLQVMQQMVQQAIADGLDVAAKKQPHVRGDKMGMAVSDDLSPKSVDDAVLRIYENEALDIVATLEPFNQRFDNGPSQISYSPFASQTPWLNEQLAELTRVLNDELRAQYEVNRQHLRDSYAALINSGVQDIQRAVDFNDQNSDYYRLYTAIEQDNVNAKEHAPRIVQARRSEIESEYERQREEYANLVAANAKQEYNRRHQSARNDELRKVETQVDSEIEAMRRISMRKLNDRRRQESKVRYDLVVNSALDTLRDAYAEFLEQEREDVQKAVKEIQTFLESHAQSDLNQAQVWSEKLAKDNRLEQYVSESNARLERMQVESETTLDAKRKELVQIKSDHEQAMEEMRNHWTQLFERETARADQAERDALSAEQRYEKRLVEMQEDSEARIQSADDRATQAVYNHEQYVESQRKSQRTNNIVLILLFVTVIIAATVFGMFIGPHIIG